MKVEIEVPDQILEFLKDVARLCDLDVKTYLEECAVKAFTGDLHAVGNTPFWKAQTLIAKYGLEEVLKK